MADFCLSCFNKMNDLEYTEEDVILEYSLCEGCGDMKPCVVSLTSFADMRFPKGGSQYSFWNSLWGLWLQDKSVWGEYALMQKIFFFIVPLLLIGLVCGIGAILSVFFF